MSSKHDLKEFLDAYIEAALWSSTDESDENGGEPMDKNYGPSDLAGVTKRAMDCDCKRFVERFGDLVEDDDSPAIRKWGTWPKAGHDFWLSRNGHGAGFFDGDWPKHGDELQEAAESYGLFELYVGDDKEIYASGAEREVNELTEHRDAHTGQFAAGPDPTGEWAVVQRMMEVYARQKGLGAYIHNSAIPAGNGDWRFWAQKPGERSKEHQVSQHNLKSTYERGGLSERRSPNASAINGIEYQADPDTDGGYVSVAPHPTDKARRQEQWLHAHGYTVSLATDNDDRRLTWIYVKPHRMRAANEPRNASPQHRHRRHGAPRGRSAPPRGGRRVRDYDVVDNRGKRLAGPFKDYGTAKGEADTRGGVVGFVAGEKAGGRLDSRLREQHEVGCPMREASRRQIRVGSRVAGGQEGTEDFDTGEVLAISGRIATVGWDSGVRTDVDVDQLRPTTERWSGGHRMSEANRRNRPGRAPRMDSSRAKPSTRVGRERGKHGGNALLSRHGSKMMATEAQGKRRVREVDAEAAGEEYAKEQINSDFFRDWVWDQMSEGHRMRKADPNSVIPLDNAADYKKLARNMLQQLEWDMDRDMTVQDVLSSVGVDSEGGTRDTEVAREFFQGVKAALKKPSVVNWLASECRAMEKELKGQERGGARGRKRKAGEVAQTTRLLPPASTR